MVVEFGRGGESYGVLQGGQGDHEGGRRNHGAHDCQVRQSGEQGRRGGAAAVGGGGHGDDRSGIAAGGESAVEGGGEERVREGGVYARGDGGGATDAAAEPAHGAAGEAGANAEAQHGAGEHASRELCGGEFALQPEFGQGLHALRIADVSSQGRARDAGESHAAKEDDDAEPGRLGTRLGHTDAANLRSVEIESEFAHHKAGLARLNNGSFGSCPKTVLAAQAVWSEFWLRQPDECYFGPLETRLHRARSEVANLIHAPVEEVFLLENVTASASMVAVDVMWALAEGRYSQGDSILTLNFTYGAVKKAFQAYAARAGARIFQVEIPFPVASEKQILQIFENALKKEREEHPSSTIRLAVFDHIISMPTMILPVCQLVKLCRSYGVENIFIDGAHGIGNLELNMKEIDADYYTSNLHKWMFAPTTAAFFHCKSKHLARLHHPIISHLYGSGIVAECSWVGTRDYSALIAVPESIQFVKDMAGSIEEYSKENHCKVVAMAEMLASAWDTYLGTPPEMCAAMAMVALPATLNVSSQADLFSLRKRLREEYQVEVHLFYAGNSTSASVEAIPKGRLGITAYVRISHQIYNKSDDYIKLRNAINDISCERMMLLNKGTWLRNISGASCRLKLTSVADNYTDALGAPPSSICYETIFPGILAYLAWVYFIMLQGQGTPSLVF